MSQKRALSRQKFEAELISAGPNGAWTRMHIPFDVPATYGSKGRVSVRGSINGFQFQSSIFPDGDGGFHMLVNKEMQQGAKAQPGDVVEVIMQMDTDERTVSVPKDFEKALKLNKQTQANFAKMTSSARREFAEWIDSAKQQQTRERRIEKAVALISQGKRLKS